MAGPTLLSLLTLIGFSGRPFRVLHGATNPKVVIRLISANGTWYLNDLAQGYMLPGVFCGLYEFFT